MELKCLQKNVPPVIFVYRIIVIVISITVIEGTSVPIRVNSRPVIFALISVRFASIRVLKEHLPDKQPDHHAPDNKPQQPAE